MSEMLKSFPRPEPEEESYEWERALPVTAQLWANRSMLVRAAVIGLLASTILAFIVPKQFESTAQLMPPDPQSSSSTLALLMGAGAASTAMGGFATSLLNPRNPGSVFLGILQSRTVADDIINRFDLRKEYNYKRYLETRKKLARRTDISEDRKTGIITLTVTDNDPVRSKELAEAYVQELDKLVAQLSTSSARRERQFLEQRLQSVKLELDRSAREMSEFSSKNGAIDIQAQGKAMLEAGARAQGELIAAEAELSGLEQIYAPTSVKVQSARARIAELKRQMQKLTGGADLDQNSSANELYPPLRQLPILGLTYYDLYRKMKIQEAVFEALTKQYEVAKVQEAREIPTVKVLDAPDVPEKKSFPPRLLIILVGVLFAISVSVLFVLAREWWHSDDEFDARRAFASTVWEVASEGGSRIRMWRIRRVRD